MNIWQSMILGFVQGVSEFLPISSSGHLVIFQNWLKIFPPPVDYDLFLHLVSMIVIVVYFRKNFLKINKEMVQFLIISTIPILIIGFLFKDYIDTLFGSRIVVAIGLFITAAFNFFAAKRFMNNSNQNNLDVKKVSIIGIFQAIAIIPGISRSGSTLFGASLGKIDKKQAFEFSFMMATVAILTATAGQLILMNPTELQSILTSSWSSYLAGGVMCFLTSLASLKLLKITLQKNGYHFFGWYCLVLGVITLGWSLF